MKVSWLGGKGARQGSARVVSFRRHGSAQNPQAMFGQVEHAPAPIHRMMRAHHDVAADEIGNHQCDVGTIEPQQAPEGCLIDARTAAQGEDHAELRGGQIKGAAFVLEYRDRDLVSPPDPDSGPIVELVQIGA